MKNRKLKKLLLISSGVLGVLVVCIVATCFYFRITSLMSAQTYLLMLGEGLDPLCKDLAFRRINKGDTVVEVVAKHPPFAIYEFGQYAYVRYGVSGGVVIATENGILISACIETDVCYHSFFDSPDKTEDLNHAWQAYNEQQRMESDAYLLHRAIVNGQDVFLSNQVEESSAPPESLGVNPDPGMFGMEYEEPLLNVQVSKVLYGSLIEGDELNILQNGNSCWGYDNPSSIVFVHFNNPKIIHPDSNEVEYYSSISKRTFDWYQELDKTQMNEFVSRMDTIWKKKREARANMGLNPDGLAPTDYPRR